MTKGECPIEEYYLMHKVYKCVFSNMCNKKHKKVCKLYNGVKKENERNNC